MKNLFKSIFVLFVVFISITSCGPTEEEIARKKRYHREFLREQAQREESIRIQNDSLIINLARFQTKFDEGSLLESITYLDSALIYSSFDSEDTIRMRKASILVSLKKYDLAIESYSELIDGGFANDGCHYLRAICFDKLGKRQEAADDLKIAIEKGDEQAKELHDKINPIRKRVSYYVTRCYKMLQDVAMEAHQMPREEELALIMVVYVIGMTPSMRNIENIKI